ncbi:hypothetical protein [Haloterrigena alkaliphila]|uniref:Uncharacterized protein n=1 Tax=Haloterrigena alkaliphila TaxID=2816475 RepID=A0A8A2V7K0_9EURY|nr:hypothetical protein [Haloterrigena alkaliphila]QSW97879.1 hypothetical protein J0X25_10660 [Haloterrigena alkaliphila]
MTPILSAPVQRRSFRPSVFVFPLGLWVVMAVVAVANGGFRETVLIPRVGEYTGHVLSTALLIAAVLVLSALYFARSSIDYSRAELLLVGILWTVLTVGFEFLVGALEGTPVSATLAQYDVFAGQVWILVPLTLLTAPLLFGAVLADD